MRINKMISEPKTSAISIRNNTAIVGCTDSLLQTIPSGVVDQINTTDINATGTILGNAVADISTLLAFIAWSHKATSKLMIQISLEPLLGKARKGELSITALLIVCGVESRIIG